MKSFINQINKLINIKIILRKFKINLNVKLININ